MSTCVDMTCNSVFCNTEIIGIELYGLLQRTLQTVITDGWRESFFNKVSCSHFLEIEENFLYTHYSTVTPGHGNF